MGLRLFPVALGMRNAVTILPEEEDSFSQPVKQWWSWLCFFSRLSLSIYVSECSEEQGLQVFWPLQMSDIEESSALKETEVWFPLLKEK